MFQKNLSRINIFSNPFHPYVITSSIVSDFLNLITEILPSSKKPSSLSNYTKHTPNKNTPNNNPENWFRTSPQGGGICLNVYDLYQDDIRHYDVDMKVEYLKNLTISPHLRCKITGKIILISNFGIVDGHDLYLRENNKLKKSILLYEFKDAYPYFYDASDSDYRLKNIMKLNLPKYSPILSG